jgi:hypothetical protein
MPHLALSAVAATGSCCNDAGLAMVLRCDQPVDHWNCNHLSGQLANICCIILCKTRLQERCLGNQARKLLVAVRVAVGRAAVHVQRMPRGCSPVQESCKQAGVAKKCNFKVLNLVPFVASG